MRGRGRAAGYSRFEKTHKVHGDGAMAKICLIAINSRLWRVSSKIHDVEVYKRKILLLSTRRANFINLSVVSV